MDYFASFYTELAPDPPEHLLSRTFCIVPSAHAALADHWHAVAITCGPTTSSNTSRKRAEDEVAAHLGMFSSTTNEAYYAMGLEVSKAVWEAVERTRDTATA